MNKSWRNFITGQNGENGENIWKPESWKLFCESKRKYEIDKHRFASLESNFQLKQKKFVKLKKDMCACFDKLMDYKTAHGTMMDQGMVHRNQSGHIRPVIIPESFLPTRISSSYEEVEMEV